LAWTACTVGQARGLPHFCTPRGSVWAGACDSTNQSYRSMPGEISVNSSAVSASAIDRGGEVPVEHLGRPGVDSLGKRVVGGAHRSNLQLERRGGPTYRHIGRWDLRLAPVESLMMAWQGTAAQGRKLLSGAMRLPGSARMAAGAAWVFSDPAPPRCNPPIIKCRRLTPHGTRNAFGRDPRDSAPAQTRIFR
jgi:hypothetical protein